MKSKVPLRVASRVSEAQRAHLRRTVRWLTIAAGSMALGACTGMVGSNDTGNPGANGVFKWEPPACDSAQTAFATGRIWQISDQEYVNAVRDVLGITLMDTQAEITAAANHSGEFSNNSEGGAVFTDNVAQNYQTVAVNVATLAIVPAKMNMLLGTTATTAATDAQLTTFLDNKVARLWRRPVTADEATTLKSIYNSGTAAADGGPGNALSLLLQAVLQAPSFLFRTELGSSPTPSTQPYKLTPFELATALSMMFLESVPDDTLWMKAQNSTLADPVVLAAEVDRLMGLQATRDSIALKLGYWLWTERVPAREKDPTLFPGYTPAVQQSVYLSGQAFVKDILVNGKLWDFFTSTKLFVNQDITGFYGVPGGTTTALAAVDTTLPERGVGLLTQPAFIAGVHKRAAVTDPIHLGLFIHDQLLCGGDGGAEIPTPPADALLKAAMMMGTERELVAQRAMQSCNACHGRFDPFGLTFQAYDATGRFSTTRQVQKDSSGNAVWTDVPSIDTSSVVAETVGQDLKGPVADVNALAARISSDGPNKRIAYCAGRKLSVYAMGYDPGAINSCALKDIKEVMFKSGSFLDFYRALATSPGFVTRNPG